MDPELKGRPIVLTKNNSETEKNFSVKGNRTLKIKANIAMATPLAIIKFLGELKS
jgi:hypothetical protein